MQDRIEPRVHRHEREEVATMAVAIVHVFAVPAQRQAHHGECHDNVCYPKQTLSPEGRFCRDCLYLDAINALTPPSNARMRCSHQGAIGFSRVI